MFCNNCGSEIKEGSNVCFKCGEKVSDTMVFNNNNLIGKSESIKNNTIIKKAIAMVGFFVVAVFAIWLIFGGRSYKKVIEVAVESSNSMTKESVEDVIKLFPEDVLAVIMEEEELDSKEELVDELFREKERYKEQLDKVDDISYKIIEEEDFSEVEIKELMEKYEETGVKLKKKIKSAKHVKVEMTIDIKGGEERSSETTYDVIKIGRKWYLADLSI